MIAGTVKELSSIMLERSNNVVPPHEGNSMFIVLLMAACLGITLGLMVSRSFDEDRKGMLAGYAVGLGVIALILTVALNMNRSDGMPGYESRVKMTQVDQKGDDAHVIFTRGDERYKAVIPAKDAERFSRCKDIRVISISLRNYDTQKRLGSYDIVSGNDQCIIKN